MKYFSLLSFDPLSPLVRKNGMPPALRPVCYYVRDYGLPFRDPEDTKKHWVQIRGSRFREKQHVAVASYSRTLPNQNIPYHEFIDISHDCTRLALFRLLLGNSRPSGIEIMYWKNRMLSSLSSVTWFNGGHSANILCCLKRRFRTSFLLYELNIGKGVHILAKIIRITYLIIAACCL